MDIDLNVRPEIVKILEENIGTTLFDVGLNNIFWICFVRQKQQQKYKQMGLHKTKKLLNKNTFFSKKRKGHLLSRRIYFQTVYPIRG